MSDSTELDPGYEVTHDDPHHAATQLANRQLAMHALALVPFVWWRLPAHTGAAVQLRALITRVYGPDCVDLLVLPDASTDLGSGYGAPHAIRSVVLGAGHENFALELDP